MQKVDRVIVSLSISSDLAIDMDLPIFMTVDVLKEKILETLKIIYPYVFCDVYEIELSSMGRVFKSQETLASIGVWDGAILEIKKKG